ncbi:MAG: hypothetical protein B7Z73_16135, partial [Planctomycetia bacterium 21-64-5]
RLRCFVTGSLAITLAGLILALATANHPQAAAAILRYYWFRLSDVMVPVGIAMHAIVGPNPKSIIQNPKCAAVVWAAICTALVVYARDDYAAWNFFASAPRADKSGKVLSHDDWRDVCQWMANQTPPDALAITPRMAQSFTWYSGRGQVVSWKDLPQDAVAVVDWWQRLVDIYGMPYPAFQGRWHDSLSELSPHRLRELGRKYGAGFLVVETEPAIDLPRQYANGSYAVYRLP